VAFWLGDFDSTLDFDTIDLGKVPDSIWIYSKRCENGRKWQKMAENGYIPANVVGLSIHDFYGKNLNRWTCER